jgi:hypothetical protein
MGGRLDEIITKFDNGYERFHTDALVNKVVMMLYYEQDPMTIIDTLIKSNNEITEAFRNYILKNKNEFL